jgi:predicted metal-dependent hydrolase
MQTITIDGVTLTLIVERKRVKNINARLRDTTLLISAPFSAPQATLDQAIPDLARRLVRRAHARQVNVEEDALALAHRVAARFPKGPEVAQVLFVTTQEARWGSYSPATGTIRLNAALRQMPRWVLEAVVAHELAHVVHQDHSPAFWKLLRRVCPDTDRARAFLAGVSWLGHHWERLPPIERALLARASDCEIDDADH